MGGGGSILVLGFVCVGLADSGFECGMVVSDGLCGVFAGALVI